MDLPASVETAWGLRERPQRGPKPGLSLTRIVTAGVAVADADGLAAVSMSRVAAELGTAPMSLYRYVRAKDELVALMADAAWGEAPGGPAGGESWRSALARWAGNMRAALYRHPWMLRVPISGLPVHPNEVTWFEQALASLRGTGLAPAEKASVIMLVSGFVRNEAATGAQINAAIRASGTSPDEWLSGYGQLLAKLADPQRFPELAAFAAAGVFDSADPPEQEFTFGLDRILDGIGDLIGTRGGGEPGPGRTGDPAQPE